jgi:hypothetical protein
MYAAQRGNVEVVKLLLKFRADTSDFDNVCDIMDIALLVG